MKTNQCGVLWREHYKPLVKVIALLKNPMHIIMVYALGKIWMASSLPMLDITFYASLQNGCLPTKVVHKILLSGGHQEGHLTVKLATIALSIWIISANPTWFGNDNGEKYNVFLLHYDLQMSHPQNIFKLAPELQ